MPTEKRFVLRPVAVLALVVAAACVVIAVVYVTTAASDLPGFFPGHQAGSPHKHVKHGLAFVGLALVALAAAWFTSAPARET